MSDGPSDIASDAAALLDLGYGDLPGDLDDEEYEVIAEWFEAVRSHGPVRLLATDVGASFVWCSAASERAWSWWDGFFCVAPDGSRRTTETVALRAGGG